MADPKDNYQLYIENAREMLEVAKLNLENEYYGSACNRAYYAIFYAARIARDLSQDKMIVVNLSGRGDKDVDAFIRYRPEAAQGPNAT